MILKPLPDRPIDPITVSVIREVKNAVNVLGLDTYLVGATARIILLEHVHGLHTGRATRDIDFAFAVESWDHFQALKTRLISTLKFEEVKGVMQRLQFKQEFSFQVAVDLIPFGGIESAAGKICWPPDMSIVMNVAGYQDGLASAVAVEIAPELVISVASIPGIAILKLFAWVDRRYEDPKDAIDLLTLLRQYHEAGNQARIYEDAIMALEAAGYDIELGGAWLLGSDAYAASSLETHSRLTALLNQTDLVDRLAIDMARANRTRHDAVDYSRALLDQFLAGFNQKQENTAAK
jgi:predicted nucleotidyltransferase